MWNDLLQYVKELPSYAWNLLLVAAALLSGLLFKAIVSILLRLNSKTTGNYSLFKSILYRLNQPVTWFLPLITLNIVLPLMELTKRQETTFNKIADISLIITFAIVLVAVVKICEDFLIHVYDLNKADNLRERKIRTQIQFIRKSVTSLIIVVAVGAVLLSFNNLRRVGAGLLTGVGISSIIVGFASQRSLGNLLAGMQIAFTQPIRLDDVLVVEDEWCRVEEITMTYVVLKIWDQRRLILPINYFIEKPFQNWTRTGSEILGTVFLHLDYTAPFSEIREEFNRLLLESDSWDKRTAIMQVTETTEHTVEIRLLVSAANSSKAFDLRCYVRENIVSFIQKNFPEALPKTRAIINTNSDLLKRGNAEKNITNPVAQS